MCLPKIPLFKWISKISRLPRTVSTKSMNLCTPEEANSFHARKPAPRDHGSSDTMHLRASRPRVHGSTYILAHSALVSVPVVVYACTPFISAASPRGMLMHSDDCSSSCSRSDSFRSRRYNEKSFGRSYEFSLIRWPQCLVSMFDSSIFFILF